MKAHYTAGITATWRHMSKVESESIKKAGYFTRFIGYLLGILDKNSVDTIAQRAVAIDSLILRLKPKYIVEIGAGFSSRPKKFKKIKFIELDSKEIKKRKKEVCEFDIINEELNLNVKEALFIVEGVTMYLQKEHVIKLLKEIKKYKGFLAIDFLNKSYSSKQKTPREKIYKMIFKLLIGRNHLFDYKIENVDNGKKLLNDLGYKCVKHIPYDLEKTLDSLFYCQL